MKPEPRPWLVSICTTEGASAAATAATGSVEPLVFATDGVVETVAVVESAPLERTIVVLSPVARATAKPLSASDSATSPTRTGDLRRPGGGPAGGGVAVDSHGGIGGGVGGLWVGGYGEVP